MLVEWFLTEDFPVQALDIDPKSPTLSRFGGLGAGTFDIRPPFRGDTADELGAGRVETTVDPLMLEVLFAQLEAAPEKDTVLDTGASCHGDFSNYMVSHDQGDILADVGLLSVAHVPIRGGDLLSRSLEGLEEMDREGILEQFTTVVLWGNGGRLRVDEHTPFVDTPVVQRTVGDKLGGVMVWPDAVVSSVVAREIDRVSNEGLTFTEGMTQGTSAQRVRLKKVFNAVMPRVGAMMGALDPKYRSEREAMAQAAK